MLGAEQKTEGTTDPGEPFWHHLMDHAFEWGSSAVGGGVLIALITAWFNRDKIKKRFGKSDD